jgi:hypothetical protein
MVAFGQDTIDMENLACRLEQLHPRHFFLEFL